MVFCSLGYFSITNSHTCSHMHTHKHQTHLNMHKKPLSSLNSPHSSVPGHAVITHRMAIWNGIDNCLKIVCSRLFLQHNYSSNIKHSSLKKRACILENGVHKYVVLLSNMWTCMKYTSQHGPCVVSIHMGSVYSHG